MFENENINIRIAGIADDEPELIPLLTQEDEDNMSDERIPEILSILPLRNTVLFPGVVIPITVGRDKSIKLIRDAYKADKIIGVVAQKDVGTEDPAFVDLNRVGTVAQVLKMLQMPDGNTTVIIQGKKRIALKDLQQDEPYIKATVEALLDVKPAKNDKEFKATVDSLKDLSLQIIQLNQQIPAEAAFAIKNIDSPSFLIHFISSNMNIEAGKKQEILELVNLKERAVKVLEHLTKELQMLELKNQIQSKVKVDLDKQQRDYFLNQQLKQIQEELGGSTPDQEVAEMREKERRKNGARM